MKFIFATFALLFSVNAFAVRYGVDERTYNCTGDADAVLVGANEKFSLHVVDLKEMTLTRLSDGKWLSTYYRNGIYDVDDKKDHGNLWDAGKTGYIMSSLDEGYLLVTRPDGDRYTKINCTLDKVISAYDPLTPTEEKVIKIGDEADVANGGYDFYRFDVKKFDFAQAKKDIVASLDGQWEGCTWTLVEGLPNVLKEVKTSANDSLAARRISALAKKPGVLGALAYVSDRDISCSNTIVWVYTTDGVKLDIFYSQGD